MEQAAADGGELRIRGGGDIGSLARVSYRDQVQWLMIRWQA